MLERQRGVEPCIFCRIVRGELGTEFVDQSDTAVAFHDLQPAAPTHVLVVPRRHLGGLRDLRDPVVAADLLMLVNRVAKDLGLTKGGYRVITNDGPDAGQTVNHLHFHVLGGQKLPEALA